MKGLEGVFILFTLIAILAGMYFGWYQAMDFIPKEYKRKADAYDELTTHSFEKKILIDNFSYTCFRK